MFMVDDADIPDVIRCDIVADGLSRISPGCPVECLRSVLSGMAFNPLARGFGAPSGPPRTVADVLELYQHRELVGISGLGPRRIAEIEVSLVYAGLITAHIRSR